MGSRAQVLLSSSRHSTFADLAAADDMDGATTPGLAGARRVAFRLDVSSGVETHHKMSSRPRASPYRGARAVRGGGQQQQPIGTGDVSPSRSSSPSATYLALILRSPARALTGPPREGSNEALLLFANLSSHVVLLSLISM